MVFAFILRKSLSGMNDHASGKLFNVVLISHILYFLLDIIWAPLNFNLINNPAFLQVIRILKYWNITLSVFAWFQYIAFKIDSNVLNTKLKVYIAGICNVISLVIALVICLTNNMNETSVYTIFLGFLINIIPFIYVLGALCNVFIKALKAEAVNKKRMWLLTVYTLMLLAGGCLQIITPSLPSLCFVTAFVMLVMYIIDLSSLIYTDPLTRLNNRNDLNRYYEEMVKLDDNFCAIMLDLDKFKQINDNFGHLEGDKALKEVASVLKKSASDLKDSYVGRYGGDEFIIILHTSSENEIIQYIESLNEMIDLIDVKKNYKISISYGYVIKEKDEKLDSLISRADKELYLKKVFKNNKNQ